MNARDKIRIKLAIDEARKWADENPDYLTGLDDDCEEISVECLTLEEVKRLLYILETTLLGNEDQNEDDSKPNICPVCGSRNVEPVIKPGDWGYYPCSVHIECKNCGTRTKEFDGKDDCDQDGAIKKALRAWNKGRVE